MERYALAQVFAERGAPLAITPHVEGHMIGIHAAYCAMTGDARVPTIGRKTTDCEVWNR